MSDNEACRLKSPTRTPWNKGKLMGAKPPLRPKHVWSIRTRLMVDGRDRDLAMFNLAIDSKLRGCEVVALKVDDVAPSGYALERATIRQRKTGQPVKFELSEQTRQAIEDYLRASGRKPGDFLFTSRRHSGRFMTTRQYARLVSEWIGSIGLDPKLFGTHSCAVQLLLGHTKIDYVPCPTMSRRAVTRLIINANGPTARDIVRAVTGF